MQKRTLYIAGGAVVGALMAFFWYAKKGGAHSEALRVAGIVAAIVSLFA